MPLWHGAISGRVAGNISKSVDHIIDTGWRPSYYFHMTKKNNCNYHITKRRFSFRSILIFIVFTFAMVSLTQSKMAISSTEASGSINEAAMKLVRYCIDPQTGLDENAIAILVDYVLSSKPAKERGLPKSKDCTGAYYEFDTKITFPRMIEYSFSPVIPPVITRPSSLRYSTWTAPRVDTQKIPNGWKPIPPGGAPVVIHGIEHDSNTPDLSTGVYHEYDMNRTLILSNVKGHQALVSVSKQISTSKVGKKGAILGNDNDWNYYYSGESGNSITGLGWAKSYIYDYFSVTVLVESGTSASSVRAGVFQWLRAGWSGINFVRETHIIGGLKRYGRDCKMILESPRLPSINQMMSVFHGLSGLSEADLLKEYTDLRQAQRSLAIQAGKISKSDKEDKITLASISKDQMVEELMLENLKAALGKPTFLKK